MGSAARAPHIGNSKYASRIERGLLARMAPPQTCFHLIPRQGHLTLSRKHFLDSLSVKAIGAHCYQNNRSGNDGTKLRPYDVQAVALEYHSPTDKNIISQRIKYRYRLEKCRHCV